MVDEVNLDNTNLLVTVHGITIELILRARKPFISSLEVAKQFDKDHFNVTRAIRSIKDPEFTAFNFEVSEYTDPTGRKLPCYQMTRDGFFLVVMGFTGPAAERVKIAIIAAFNRMEAALLLGTDSGVRQELAELQAVALRTESRVICMDGKVTILTETLEATNDTVDKVVHKVEQIGAPRKPFKQKDKNDRIKWNRLYGGQCVFCAGQKGSVFDAEGNWIGEFDHWEGRDNASLENCVPICKACHSDLTEYRVKRAQWQPKLDAFLAFITNHSRLKLIPVDIGEWSSTPIYQHQGDLFSDTSDEW